MAYWYAAAAGVQVVGSLIGGSKAASAAKKQAKMQNEAAGRQLHYDMQKWNMDKQKIIADRQYAIDQINAKIRTEGRVAAFQDATNLSKYNYDMMIRNREQSSLNSQYVRSDQIYAKQVDLNSMSYGAAINDEVRKYEEIEAESKFNAQDHYIDTLVTEGKLRARGIDGRSAAKIGQATMADFGRRISMIDESIEGAGRNARAMLKEIAADKEAADLAAWAQKMLDPGVLPTPIVPFKTPLTDWVMPREIGRYDFGPQPVMGAMASPSAAANMVWGNTITSAAGALGAGIASTHAAGKN